MPEPGLPGRAENCVEDHPGGMRKERSCGGARTGRRSIADNYAPTGVFPKGKLCEFQPKGMTHKAMPEWEEL